MVCGDAYVRLTPRLIRGWVWLDCYRVEAFLRGFSGLSCVQQLKRRSLVGARVRLPKNVTFAGLFPLPCDRSSRL